MGRISWPPTVADGRPLPLRPAGSVEITPAVHVLETDEAGAVFLDGMASWCWERADVVGRRLAAVQLSETNAARPGAIAAAFGVEYETLRCWRLAWRERGVEGLVPQKTGAKRPLKLTEEKREEIAALCAQGLGLRAIARAVGLDPSTVRRGLPGPAPTAPTAPAGSALEPLARPELREAERALARAGLLFGAEPVICEGASLPFAGALLVLPALAATGLLEAFTAVFSAGRTAFYSLRSLVLCVVFCLLLGEARAEGLTRLDPTDLGRLLGLDRAPEVKTMRRRMEELAALKRSDELLASSPPPISRRREMPVACSTSTATCAPTTAPPVFQKPTSRVPGSVRRLRSTPGSATRTARVCSAGAPSPAPA